MIWTIGAWMLLVLGLGLFGYGLFWDRPGFRGRPERWCRKCGYDLSDVGDVPVKCTECGRVHERERSLRRVRRHKRVAVLGVLVMIGAGVLAVMPAVSRGTLFKPFPNWVLVELQPLFPENANAYKNHPSRELSDRLNDTKSPKRHAEVVEIIRALAKGSVFAEAGSERWARTSGAWFGARTLWFGFSNQELHYPDLTPADETLRGALDELMRVLPKWYPGTRARWPEGHRVTISSGTSYPHWSVLGDLSERAVVRLDGHPEIVVDEFFNHFKIDPIGEAGDVIEGEIELSLYRVESGERAAEAEPERVQTFPVRWEVVGTLEEAAGVVTDAELIGAHADDLAVAVVQYHPGNEFYPYGLHRFIMSGAFAGCVYEGIGFGVRIELLDGAELIRAHRVRWVCRDGKTRMGSSKTIDGVPTDKVHERIACAIEAETLNIRIESDSEWALGLMDEDSVWVGSVEVSYAEAVERLGVSEEKAPPNTTGP